MGVGFCAQCNKECNLIESEGECCCMECGTVVSENRSVETMEFEESGGGFKVVGTRVDKFGATHGGQTGYSRPSSEVTINRARLAIEDVVFNLKMPRQIIKGATRLYKLLLGNNFTRGRKSSNVIATVVYATCRMHQPRPLPYMLLDFSDYFSTNVFELGHTFLRLSAVLSLRLPLIDPSLFIPRYAHDLDFGIKEHRISKCAVRLVSRMKRDWIVTGRRPGGICAAALLIAGRLNGFTRTMKDLSLIVHLSTTTIRKRLSEFKDTSTCNLTPVEFDSILDFDDIASSDPPAFTRSRKKAEELRNIPVLTVDEIHERIQHALGVLDEDDLNTISASPLAPPNERRQEIMDEADKVDTPPPAKRPKLSHTTEEYDEEYEQDDSGYFDSLNPENYIYDDPEEVQGEQESEPIEESLSDIDDDEIDSLINSETEIRMNEIIWKSMYSSWEKDQEDKEELQRQAGTYKSPLERAKKKEPKRLAESPAEAVSVALSRRLVSSKINQSAIERLVQASAGHVRPQGNPLLDFVKVPATIPINGSDSDSD